MNYLESVKQRREEISVRVEELENELIPLKKELDALDNLIRIAGKEDNQGEITNDYPFDSNLKIKIKYVLKEIGEGTASQIESFMRQHEKEVSSNSITITSSLMAKEGEVKITRKEGRSNVYSL